MDTNDTRTGISNSESKGAPELEQEIQENNDQIRELYREIGEIYCGSHKENAEPDLKNLVSAVTELQDRNITLEDQIQGISGKVRCEACGAYVDDDSVFCVNCGHRMVPVKENGCPNCGADIKDEFVFCPVCGARIPEQEPELEQEKALEQEPELEQEKALEQEPELEQEKELEQEPELEPAKRKCPNCGAELGDDDLFCMECGTKIEEPAAQSAAAPTGKKCPNCGADLGDDDIFCMECGTKVN